MKINTKVRYGLRAMMEIAIHRNEGGVFQKDIAQRQGISMKYLDQIIMSLKASGLIINASGKKSGYVISKSLEEITAYDIYKAFQSDLSIVDCLQNNVGDMCPSGGECVAKEFWGGLNDLMINYLKSVNLHQLVEKQELLIKKEDKNLMFYI